MAAKVPITAMGSASEGMMVAESVRRNRKITATTSTAGDDQRGLHIIDRSRGWTGCGHRTPSDAPISAWSG